MKDILVKIADTIADEVIYGERQEQNMAETTAVKEWLCFIDEINSGSGMSNAAAHSIVFQVAFSFVKPVPLEGDAVNNDVVMAESKAKCISMLNGIIKSGEFDALGAWGIEKVRENENDANLIGWRIKLDLTPLEFSGVC